MFDLNEPADEPAAIDAVPEEPKSEECGGTEHNDYNVSPPGVISLDLSRCSSWPRSERPSLLKSPSFNMLFKDEDLAKDSVLLPLKPIDSGRDLPGDEEHKIIDLIHSVGHERTEISQEQSVPKNMEIFWQGSITHEDLTVQDVVAACTGELLRLFKDRRLPDRLSVQRLVGTDKFVNSVKEYMVEPAVRVLQKLGTSSQTFNKLVQILAGGSTDSDLTLNSPSSKAPSRAIIPLCDEKDTGICFANLHLVSSSILSEAEPGELSSSEEDTIYGFLCLSPSNTDDSSYDWLKEVLRTESAPKPGSETVEDIPVDIPADPAVSAASVDTTLADKKVATELPENRQQDLEEGQVSEDQGVKEVIYPTHERRSKRYNTEDDKKVKPNGETETKSRDRDRDRDRDRYRHRDHDREREQDRRRERDDYRDRERDYARRPHEYGPRLDTKSSRHRDDRERSIHRDTWENGGRIKERVKESERSKSREREREKDRDRPSDKSSKEGSRARRSESKRPEPVERRKRERSPMDASYRSNGKRAKDAGVEDAPQQLKVAEKPAAVPEDKTLPRTEVEVEQGAKGKGERVALEEKLEENEEEVAIEMLLEVNDPDSRSWLTSKQNAIYLREDFGVTLLRKETSSPDLAARGEEQGALHLKLSGKLSETCETSEAKYFVILAAESLKEIAERGIFCKCLWYPGPVQQPSSGSVIAPSVQMVLKKIKGEDGKNLERIQEVTGVMVGNYVDEKTSGKGSTIGICLKTARKRGLMEATQQAKELLHQVSLFFAKEMDIPAEANIQSDRASMENGSEFKNLLFVTNIPEYASNRMLRAIFENVLREKLNKENPPGFDMVSNVEYAAEEGYAFVEFARDEFFDSALHLYTSDKDVFCGLKVEIPPPHTLKLYEHLLDPSDPRLVRRRAIQVSESESEHFPRTETSIKPLFLTELIRNATQESIKRLFEEIITSHINPSLDGKSLVQAVRHVPSRGCMFVDLATPELVDFMLDLHKRKPEIFGNMKMEIGRGYSSYEFLDRKRSFHALDKSRSDRNISPRPLKRRELDEDDENGPGYMRQISRKNMIHKSDPEKTVYADHLPENSSDVVIRKIFRSVLLEHMTPEQRTLLGDEVVTEVRHVRTKYCAFVVFVSEELARLALELYSHDEEIFDHMRLKPHFNSRLEDIYKEEQHEHEEYDYDFQEGLSSRGRRGFKEVDRRRSVYIDRIPEKFPESAIKEVLDKFLRRKGRSNPSYVVSHVSFFRDKYDSSKLCAFVEVKNEDAVQDLLDCYAQDEGAFEGMRIRPAVKY